MANIKIIGYGAAILATLLLGSVGVFIRNISADAFIISFSRISIGLIFLVIFLVIKKQLHTVKKSDISFPIVASGILLSLTIVCYVNAINNTSLANAAFLLYLGPIIGIAIAAVFLNERLTLLSGILLCAAFLGLICLMELDFSLTLHEAEGYLWGSGASLCYALFIVFNRKIPQNTPALTRTFYQFLFAATAILPFLDDSIFTITSTDFYWLIAVGFFQGFLATTLLIAAIKHLEVIEYGIVCFTEPLAACIIGFAFFSEILTPLQVIGCTIIMISGVIQVISTERINPSDRPAINN